MAWVAYSISDAAIHQHKILTCSCAKKDQLIHKILTFCPVIQLNYKFASMENWINHQTNKHKRKKEKRKREWAQNKQGNS